jgi:hypothetical protein
MHSLVGSLSLQGTQWNGIPCSIVNCFVFCILWAHLAEHQPSGVAYHGTGHPQTRQISIRANHRVAGAGRDPSVG